MPKVSICIAVYNAEKHIEQCVRSLFAQTLDDLEYIFVDDASPDASIDVMLRVLEDYPHRKNQIKLIRHEINQGVAATRKDAIAAATGKYVIHCDPDDWVDLDMYESMYAEAVVTDADVVICNASDEYMKPFASDVKFVRENPDLAVGNLREQITCSLWNKLYKVEIVHSPRIKYDDSLRSAEDGGSVLQYFLLCKKSATVDKYFYHYRTSNEGSVTKKDNVLHHIRAIEFAEEILKDTKYLPLLEIHKIRNLIKAIKSDKVSVTKWHSLWKTTKWKFLFIKYPIKMKLIFYVACINFSLAQWIWKKYGIASKKRKANRKCRKCRSV